MSNRLFIGQLSSRASERDVEHFFRRYGRIRDIVLKDGFGFVELEDNRDAEDAVYELNGKELCGDRVVVEFSRARGVDRDRGGRGYDRRDDRGGRGYDRRGGDRYDGGQRSRFAPPKRTRYRLTVDNLSSRISWQDLKDMLRKAGCEVTYADAHRIHRNEATVCFETREDLQLAIDKFDDKEINGRRVKLIESPSSRSRSRSPRRSRSRSDRRSRSARRSRSRSGRRSRSSSARRSPSHSRSRDGSPSPKKSKRSQSRSVSRSPSRDRSIDKDKKRSATPDRGYDKEHGDSSAKKKSEDRMGSD